MARIGAVHVAGQTAAQQRVVESGVELHLVVAVGGLHADPPQPLLPHRAGRGLRLVEGERFGLGPQIEPRILDRGVREAHLHGDRLPLVGAEREAQPRTDARGAARSGMELGSVERVASERLLVRDGREVERHGRSGLVFPDVFRFGDDPALDAAVVGEHHLGIAHGAALALTVADIEQDAAPVARRERIALEGHARRGGQLGLDAVILQHDRIVARSGELLLAVEARAVARRRVARHAGHRLQRSDRRHQDDPAHLEFVDAREPLDRIVAVVVAGGLPPRSVAEMAVGRRRRLGHAERHRPRREVEPAAVGGADARFHVGGELLETGAVRPRRVAGDQHAGAQHRAGCQRFCKRIFHMKQQFDWFPDLRRPGGRPPRFSGRL